MEESMWEEAWNAFVIAFVCVGIWSALSALYAIMNERWRMREEEKKQLNGKPGEYPTEVYAVPVRILEKKGDVVAVLLPTRAKHTEAIVEQAKMTLRIGDIRVDRIEVEWR
jgi:hypothetical protein